MTGDRRTGPQRGLLEVFYQEIIPRLTIEKAYPDVAFRKRQGRYWQAGCPIHGGTDPNFSVDTQTLSWNCFSHCGHGSLLAFMNGGESPRGPRFVELVQELAQRVDVHLDTNDVPPSVSAAVYRGSVLEAFAALAADVLTDPAGASALAYLRDRGLPEDPEVLTRLGVGVYPPTSMLARLRVPDRDLWEFGLRDSRWIGRIVVPWRDSFGRIATIVARGVGPSEPRYLYLRDAPLPPLFRSWRPRRGQDTRRAILVEGIIDALALTAHGVDGVLAIGGSSVSERHVRALQDEGLEVATLALDADAPGQAASRRLIELIQSVGTGIRVQVVPRDAYQGAKDPAELIQRHGAAAIEPFLDARLPHRVWKATLVLEGLTPNSPISRRRDALIALIALVEQADGAERAADAEDIWSLTTAALGYSDAVVRTSLGLPEAPLQPAAGSDTNATSTGESHSVAPASVADAIVEALEAVGQSLSVAKVTHILRGSRGPMTQELVGRLHLQSAGSLTGHQFKEDHDIVVAASLADSRLALEGTTIRLTRQSSNRPSHPVTSGGRPWRPIEDAELERLWLGGKSVTSIATLHRRSVGGIVARVAKLGLAIDMEAARRMAYAGANERRGAARAGVAATDVGRGLDLV